MVAEVYGGLGPCKIIIFGKTIGIASEEYLGVRIHRYRQILIKFIPNIVAGKCPEYLEATARAEAEIFLPPRDLSDFGITKSIPGEFEFKFKVILWASI